MPPPNSSISSSEDNCRTDRPVSTFAIINAIIFTFLWLSVFDIAINILFKPPSAGPQTAGSLQRYFDFGRSIEGKLRQTQHPDYIREDSLLLAGWSREQKGDTTPLDLPQLTSETIQVHGYGMSFSNRVLRRLGELDSRVFIRLSSGPGAPLIVKCN